MKDHSVTIEECFEDIKSYIKKPEDLALIEKAWQVAHKAHQGQMRKSGEPYEVHVIAVADILAKIGCTPETIAAGFLHDVVEDCEGYTVETIEKLFNSSIAGMVDGVTKVERASKLYEKEEVYQADNHRKIFVSMARDPRVMYIKLADRLHNLRTLQYQSRKKQKSIAKESLEVYAPIAHRLGISVIKNEIEDISFRYLHPRKYQEIKQLVNMQKDEREEEINEMMKQIKTVLDDHHMPYFSVTGRSKHFYSVYKKITEKHKKFSEIYDLQAIRIVTETKQDCYNILGYIHANFVPVPGRMKDYIAVPKNNMYQSLHTIVKIPGLTDLVEIQIRTREMDKVAEVGVAAHFHYKENSQKDITDYLTWFRGFARMVEEESSDAMEFMDILNIDIFSTTLCCFTPQGKPIYLPKDSTPIDFAYRIHTEVGNQTIGAKVNGTMVPLDYKLANGSTVEIITSKNSPGPSQDWLRFVKSPHARNKIRSYYQKLKPAQRKELIKKGEKLLDQLLEEESIEREFLNSRQFKRILQGFNIKDLEDLALALASSRITPAKLLDKIKTTRPTSIGNEEILEIFNKNEKKGRVSACGVIVDGADNVQVALAPCCHPLPGDEIIGYVSKSKGIRVHRTDCPNIKDKEPERLVKVYWGETDNQRDFEARLSLLSDDRNFLLQDIVTTLQKSKVTIRSISSQVNDDELTATTLLTLIVKDSAHLSQVMANLSKIKSVYSVERSVQ